MGRPLNCTWSPDRPGLICTGMLCGWNMNTGNCMAFVFDAVIPYGEFKLGTVFDPDAESRVEASRTRMRLMCDDDYEELEFVPFATVSYP